MAFDTLAACHIPAGDVARAYSTIGADGAVTQKSGTVVITKAGVCAITIGNPVSGAPADGGDDGKELTFVSVTASAHTVTRATTGFNDAGASGDVATFGGAKGDGFTILAYAGKWYVRQKTNVTIA